METAEAVVSEYGLDLHQFAHEKKFVAHLQLAPHSPKSGGKPLKKKRRTQRTSRAGQALPTVAVTLGGEAPRRWEPTTVISRVRRGRT